MCSATGLVCVQPLGWYVFSHWAGTGLVCVQPLGWCVFSHSADVCSAAGLVCVRPLGWYVFSAIKLVCIQSPDWYGVNYGYFITCCSCTVFNAENCSLQISGAQGVCPLLTNLGDPELRRLAAALPATVLRSRADSTTKKYLGAYRRWKIWTDSRQGVPSFPVQDVHLALYLQHLSESVESKAAAEEVVHALSWLPQMAGLNPVGASPLVQVTLAGIKRIVARPKVRKEPVTVEMLQAMVDTAGMEPSLTEVRLLAVCLLAFTGFLHCDELIKLQCSDISFNAEGMRVSIKSSKTDQ